MLNIEQQNFLCVRNWPSARVLINV